MFKTPRRQSGATLVEMAIIAPVFLLVLVSIIELSMMFFATLTMQYAVREGARFAVTGRANDGGNKMRYETVLAKIRDNSVGIYDKVNPDISVNGKAQVASSYSNAMFGSGGEMVVVQFNCTWLVTTPLLSAFFTDGKYRFAVATTMKNEFF